MVTEAEELQAREFLKRAEIHTMKKDLQALREADALKERYKIVNVKTLEEQRLEQEKKLLAEESAKAQAQKAGVEKVLGQNAVQERVAEKDIKEYATEQERQQIFLLESQRLGFEKEIDSIDKIKDPLLKMEKNKALIEKGNWEAKLTATKADIAKLDAEENFLEEKIKQTNIPAEKKGLEARRWDIEDQRKQIEKKTWEIEKQLETIETKIKEIDKSSNQLTTDRNGLNQKVLGIDKSLREIYSTVIARVEEKRRGQAADQKSARESTAKARSDEKEKVQRQQWAKPIKYGPGQKNQNPIIVPMKKKVTPIIDADTEQKQREQFMQDVDKWVEKKDKGPLQDKINAPVAPLPPKK